jgi:SAM-dependent methyltransferase
MANGKAVVSECAPETEVYDALRPGLRLVPYEGLVQACLDLLNHPDARRKLGEAALAAAKSLAETEILRGVLRQGRIMAVNMQSERALPARINLGSGKDWREDFLNVDIVERVNPDVLLNVCQPLPFGQQLLTQRFGPFVLNKGDFDLIMANDVLEHLPDLVSAMRSCLDLLRPGGELHAQVPYDLSWGAWQDPTHVRAFNERSWLYYTDWHWYLGWNDARFDLVKQDFVLSPYGLELSNQGRNVEEILRSPRAVDSIRAVLRKRVL